jgi:hypothetical protein
LKEAKEAAIKLAGNDSLSRTNYMKPLIGNPGFGIFYDTFYPESGPSPDDGSDLIDWVETEEEAKEIVEEGKPTGSNWIYPNHFHYEPMNRPEMLPREKYEVAMREEKSMWQKVENGEITAGQFYDWLYGDEKQDITERPTVLGDLAACDCGL